MGDAGEIDSGDEDLRLAIALSMQEQAAVTQSRSGNIMKDIVDITKDLTDADEQNRATMASNAVPVRHGILGLDRKAMEEERLARKRKAPISPPICAKIRKATDGSAQRIHDHPPNRTAEVTAANTNGQLHEHSASGNTTVRFPAPVVKKTWAFGFPRAGEDVKLEEVLERVDLNLAVLSSFQWDVEWLLGKINTATTKVIMVMQAKDEATRQQYARETADMANLRLCFPSMEGQVNCMHSKLMLLAHPDYLRVVVPTANLVPYDWGESGVMENTLFLIDLPRHPKGCRTSPDDLTFFGKELIYFCHAMRLQTDVVNSLYDFNFSATKDVAFVHTIGGVHSGETEPWRRTGYCGLGRAVQHLGLGTAQPLRVDFIASSVGAVDIDFLIRLYLAAQGSDGLREYTWRVTAFTKAARKRDHSWRDELVENIENNFRLYFPSRDTVVHSRGGVGCGGPICFQSKWYKSSTIVQHILRDCKSTREGLLMHNKLLYVRPQPHRGLEASSRNCAAWAYIGSANCSESAWGKLVQDKVTNAPKLNCRNWECGVIIPARASQQATKSGDEVPVENNLSTFGGIVPIPIQYPGEEMKDRKPWYYAE
ncbi:hypothetical protein MMC17_004198 [Xylographa soralifera]|nr:hypothetical protein [Xylographa soralifera]